MSQMLDTRRMALEAIQERALILAIPLGVAAAALAVVSATVSPLLSIAIGGAGVIFAVACMRPLWLAYASILGLALEFELQEFAFFDLTPAKGLLIACAAGWITRQLVLRKPLIIDTPLTLPLIAVILVTMPGLLFAQEKLTVANTVATWIVMFFVFQAVVEGNDPKFVRRLMFLLAIVGIALGLLAITDTSFHSQAAGAGGTTTSNRADAGFGSPNVLGALLVTTILPAACLFFSGPWWRRAVCAVSAGLGIYGLLLTSSRGALLGLFAGVLAVSTWRPVRRAVILFVIVMAALSFGGINPLTEFLERSAIGERIESVTSNSAASSDPRVPVYHHTLQIIADHPLFGVGANDYVSAAKDYGVMSVGIAPGHAHNGPLTIAADRGLIGLADYIWLVFALARMMVRGLAKATGERRAMLTGIAAVFVATAAHNLVDYTLSAVAIGTLLILAGCAVVLIRAGEAEAEAEGEDGDSAPARPLRVPQALGQPGV
jgi:O-antigen ligase